MHLFHIPQCSIQNANVHMPVLDGALWDMEQVHSWICELGQLIITVSANDERPSRDTVATNTLRPRQDGHHDCRRHFQMHFLEWKLLYFKLNFTEVCSQGSNWQYASIGSDNGWVPIRWQAIICNNVGLVYWSIYTSLGLDGLKKSHMFSWWRHQMETFSALLALCVGNSPVTGEFPAQRPVTRSFDVFFDLHLNKWLSKW